MATKSVIDIDVNDEKFKAFTEMFNKYTDRLESMPDDWEKIGGSMSGAGDDFAKMAAGAAGGMELAAMHAAVLNKGITDAILAQKNFKDETEGSLGVMEKLVKSSGNLAGNIFKIAGTLLKVSGLGLLGGGVGLFGLDKLSGSVTNTQSDARSLGLTTGQLQAFRINYGRYGDPDSILSRAANAQSSLGSQAMLAYGLHESMGQLQNQNPEQIAAQMALNAHDWWVKTNPAMRNQETLATSGIDKVYDFNQVRQFGAASRSELMAANRQFSKDVGSVGFDDKTAENWAQLNIQLKRAGLIIESTLINKLGPLAPSLTALSGAVADGVVQFLKIVANKENIAAFSKEFNQIADRLKQEDFVADFNRFKKAFNDVTDTLNKLAHPYDTVVNATSDGMTSLFPGTPAGQHVVKIDDGPVPYTFGLLRKSHLGLAPNNPINAPSSPAQANTSKQALVNKLNAQYGLPAGFMDAVWNKESGRGANTFNKKSGAMGDWQFMRKTALEFGVTDRMDFMQESKAAARKLAGELRAYKGDMRKALAAYNDGEGNVVKDVRQAAKHGGDWLSYARPETRNYVNKILITLENKAGADIAVSANNLAQ